MNTSKYKLVIGNHKPTGRCLQGDFYSKAWRWRWRPISPLYSSGRGRVFHDGLVGRKEHRQRLGATQSSECARLKPKCSMVGSSPWSAASEVGLSPQEKDPIFQYNGRRPSIPYHNDPFAYQPAIEYSCSLKAAWWITWSDGNLGRCYAMLQSKGNTFYPNHSLVKYLFYKKDIKSLVTDLKTRSKKGQKNWLQMIFLE